MSKIFALPPKIQPMADIQLPPNFELYSKNAEKVEEVRLELPARLGQNNPLAFPSQASAPIRFEGSEMGRLNLDNLLNPHKNDIEFMERELKEYRQQVQAKNEEFKLLERQRNEIKNAAAGGASLELLQAQEAKQAELLRIQTEKQALLNALQLKKAASNNSPDARSPLPPAQPAQVRAQAPPPPGSQVVQEVYDDFFDRKEIIQETVAVTVPQQQFGFVQPAPAYTYNTSTTTFQTPAQPRPSGTVFVNQVAPQGAPQYAQSGFFVRPN